MGKSNRGKTIAVIKVDKVKGRNPFTFHPKMLLRHQTEEFVDDEDKRTQNKELKEMREWEEEMEREIDEDEDDHRE